VVEDDGEQPVTEQAPLFEQVVDNIPGEIHLFLDRRLKSWSSTLPKLIFKRDDEKALAYFMVLMEQPGPSLIEAAKERTAERTGQVLSRPGVVTSITAGCAKRHRNG
jgi:hypothetical protein